MLFWEGFAVVPEILPDGKKTVGIRETGKAVEKDKVSKVYVAKDAEKRVISSLLEACNAKNIEVVEVDSMEELGKACLVSVPASAAALLK